MGNTHVRHGKGHTGSRPPSPDSMGTSPPDSPGHRSPLTFSPQLPMNPIPKQEEFGSSSHARNIPGSTAQTTFIPTVITWRYETLSSFLPSSLETRLIPPCNIFRGNLRRTYVGLPGSHGGNVVEVQGSFDNWSTRQSELCVRLTTLRVGLPRYHSRFTDMGRTSHAFNDVLVVPFSNFGAETRIDSWCDTQYKFIVDGEWKYAPDQPAMYDEMGNVNNVLEVQEYIPENLDSLSGFQPPASPASSYNQVSPSVLPQ
eukprot:1194626-Prorocentrum_minimum.AAC.8